MSDFFLYRSNNKDYKIDRIIEDYQNIYSNPTLHKSNINGFSIFFINNGSIPFIPPIFSEKLKKHLWIQGSLLLTDELIRKFSINSGSSYIPNKDIIVNLFEEKGIEIFSEFSGWFNIISYSSSDDEIEVINSHLGMLPLYYYNADGKVILSSRLGVFYHLIDEPEIDKGAVIQQCLYNYVFSNSTHLKNVKSLPAASILKITGSENYLKNYWSLNKETLSKPLNIHDSTDLLNEILNSVIKKLSSLSDKIALSLTGGWDGRLILAYILKYFGKENLTLYSFGTNSSPDITIPSDISKKHNLKYIPIILGDNYLTSIFPEYARKSIFYSDSLRSMRRTHYLYAMDLIKEYSGYIITGIGGSNLLKSTAYKPGNVFNQFVFGLLGSKDPDKEIANQYNYVKSNFAFIDNTYKLDDFVTSFDLPAFEYLYEIDNFNERFCTYLINNIERKYFGAEISAYRHLVFSYSPFLDFEFLKGLFKTSFFGGYNKIKLFPSLQNALLYKELIERNNDFLAKENTDRNISLNNVLNPLTYLNKGFKYFSGNKGRKNTGLYNTKSTIKLFVEKEKLNINELINSEQFNDEFVSNYISISWYIKQMSKGKLNLNT